MGNPIRIQTGSSKIRIMNYIDDDDDELKVHGYSFIFFVHQFVPQRQIELGIMMVING